MDYRTGLGIDVHRLEEGLPFILGGVFIPHNKGFVAYSDGDVLIHALCDAILGALGERDIGAHFPDSEAEFRNIDSRILLRRVVGMMKDKKFRINNIDIVVLAQKPKISMYIDQIKKNLAEDMETDIGRLGIKASTTEFLGYEGREEGVSVFVTVLLCSET
jgi:2-C-methyl-D-erythritol 2,4-cyclodiphosphate synthase